MKTEETSALREGKHACVACEGFVESELLSLHPEADICLDCMAPEDRSRLEEELHSVQRLDRAGLTEPPRLEGWETGVYYRPSRILSGDFYDVRHTKGKELDVVVGDVMGKGIPAALLRAGLLSALQVLAPENRSPADLLTRVNRQFLSASSSGHLATAFYGVFDTAVGDLRYASAGHPPALVRRAQGGWESLHSTGLVLGALENAEYVEKNFHMEPGDRLLVYSDGITEAESGNGEEFGETTLKRVADSLCEVGPTAPHEMAVHLVQAVEIFAPGPPSDDRTLVVIERSRRGARDGSAAGS